MDTYKAAIDLATNPKHTRWLSPTLIAAEAVLCGCIIWKVPCRLKLSTTNKAATNRTIRHRNRLDYLHATSLALCARRNRLHSPQRLHRAPRLPSIPPLPLLCPLLRHRPWHQHPARPVYLCPPIPHHP